MTMAGSSKNLVDVQAPGAPRETIKLRRTAIADTEELVVSQTIDDDNLRRLLASLVQEECTHSWKNFGPEATADGLHRWENERRPTRLFFFYLAHSGEARLVAAGAIAERLTRDFPHAGFCVLGRCYIMPEFRGQGFYRRVLQYRLEYCRAEFGDALNAVHIGSDNEWIARVVTNPRLPRWSRFIHIGEEELKVGGQVKTVEAYMLFTPKYVVRIFQALAGAHAPDCVVDLRNALGRIEAGDICNLGLAIKAPAEEARARGWFDERDSHGLEQLLLFCRSIPLVGFG